MLYMVEVDVLVAAGVFGLAGVFILALFAWTEAKKYAHVLSSTRSLRDAVYRDSFAISRANFAKPHYRFLPYRLNSRRTS